MSDSLHPHDLPDGPTDAAEPPPPRFDRLDAAALVAAVESARALELHRDPHRVIRWAHEVLGDGLMMTTSFQKSGMAILHMVRDIAPRLPVYFIDTGFHFAKSLEFAEQIRREWGINLILQRPGLFGEAFHVRYGKLHERNPELCCQLNKVEPQRELLERYQGWIAGVRRDQSATRAAVDSLEVLEGAKLKVQPLAYWERSQVDAYLAEHRIPVHPLFAEGYTSIGCAPCTQPNTDLLNERAGRWIGKAKTECGLHTFWKVVGKNGTEPGADAERPREEGKGT
ncbi:MAG TPA: phosphoadenylyl-sulfate reductase [Planctomycetota bacterium]|nr:phosphoadenylyl-sulfate reductase [Planctomycetota bacterium]